MSGRSHISFLKILSEYCETVLNLEVSKPLNEEIRKLIDNLYDCFMPVNKRPETSIDHIIRSDNELFLIKEISSKTLDVIEGDIQEIEPYNTILKPINTYL